MHLSIWLHIYCRNNIHFITLISLILKLYIWTLILWKDNIAQWTCSKIFRNIYVKMIIKNIFWVKALVDHTKSRCSTAALTTLGHFFSWKWQTNFCFVFRFLGSNDTDNFFSRAQRSRIVFEILSTTTFGREKKGEVGNNDCYAVFRQPG